jgi:cell division protein FtsB
MKNTILTLLGSIFITATVFISCKPATNDEVEATENVKEANKELLEAKKAATVAEWDAFKNSGDSILNINEARIAELKLKMKKTGNAMDAKYEKNIATLEEKNNTLKTKMKAYKNDTNADWKSFKTEFNHDMDELGSALKDLTVDNKK